MIEGLKPYAEYKESGHRWLGSVPTHWSVLPNRALFDEVKDRNHPKEEMLSVTITRGIVRQKALLEGSSKKDSSNLNKGAYKLVQPHDIAYNKMRAWQGALGASILRGIISPAYVVMRPRKEANPWFYHNLYRTPSFAKEAERWSYGITSDMWSLRPEHFKVIGSVLPPPDEQAAIVRFLDHANRKIDGFIRAKRKLIGLLNEQKQAIIHRAVTRGLHPDVPLKPSGIPWLGDIPMHWEVRKIKSLVSTYGGMTPSKGEAEYWKGTIPWVSPKDMKVREIHDSQDHISHSALRQTGIALIQPPAVLIVVRGMILARTFPTAITAVPVTINQDMKALVPKPGLSPDYFVSLLTGIQADLLLLIEIAGHGTCCLRTDAWGSFVIPVPPLSEQSEIEQHLKDRLSIQNTAIARTEREIALMQEYRTRLTADLVTGKLDVRAAAAKLPESAAEEAQRDELAEVDEEEVEVEG
jgi:type I restriction enzyme S subunit